MKFSIALFGLLFLVAPIFATEIAAPPVPKKYFKIVQAERLIYPPRMLNDGVSSGSARVVMHVDAEGKLVDWLFVSYSHRPFADEVERVLKKSTFEPEQIDGKPVDTVVDIAFNFEVNGVMLVQRFGVDTPNFDFLRRVEYQACSLRKIDRIPTPINIINPAYPKEWAEQGITGKVAVDFYIDETGKVRLPATVQSSHPLLSTIAVEAVSKWQFTPPTRKGQPVLVHAQQVFEFHKEVVKDK